MSRQRAEDRWLPILELRAMRLDVVLAVCLMQLVLSMLLRGASDPAGVSAILIERICPLLFVPVFASVLTEDRRIGTHAFVASAPRAWRVQVRRLTLIVLSALPVCLLLGLLWHRAIGYSVLTVAATAFGPMLMLGAIAYAASVVTASQSASMVIAAVVWIAEQSPGTASVLDGPLRSLYLFPLSVAGDPHFLGHKLGITIAALSLLALSVWARDVPSRWFDR